MKTMKQKHELAHPQQGLSTGEAAGRGRRRLHGPTRSGSCQRVTKQGARRQAGHLACRLHAVNVGHPLRGKGVSNGGPAAPLERVTRVPMADNAAALPQLSLFTWSRSLPAATVPAATRCL